MVRSVERFSILMMVAVTVCLSVEAIAARSSGEVVVSVTPAAAGRQLVRMSLPMPKDMLRDGQTLIASDGRGEVAAALRPLTRYPGSDPAGRSIRRALVTFPHTFETVQPVRFVLKPAGDNSDHAVMPVKVSVRAGQVRVVYRNGPVLTARLIAPARTSDEPAETETVESNSSFLWQWTHLSDAQWPRVIEIRVDALGGVTVVAHVQRNLEGDAYAPDLGWQIEIEPASQAQLRSQGRDTVIAGQPVSHSFVNGAPCELLFGDGRYCLYHPAAPLKRRGRVDVSQDGESLRYRYLRCAAHERVPIQQAAWQRAEFVVAPAAMAHLTPALQYPHQPQVDWRLWDGLYQTGAPLDPTRDTHLPALLRYHRDAVVHSMALGDDWGNVTGYADGATAGGAFGMNRLNHCPAIFEEAWRSGDRRLLDVALLWCDNFYDQSIWWGPGETGGTRYNNIIAMGRTPPDNDQSYMWRSNSAVSFCTKGFESFFLAYEETGDPRMLEALEAQVRYAHEHVHVDRGEARTIGDARDFVRLYELTGERRYLDEALQLFRELRTKLSAGDLFSQSGDPIEPDPPFIDEDATGYKHPFAKPYIIGYALSGPPGLMRYAPDEPKLRQVVQAVADFLAQSEDPVGGWRYPHPRSSRVIVSQAMEHAWQVMQADEAIGAQEHHLDAIERVLRQRIQGWLKTGKVFDGLTGWEWATGKVKQSSELCAMYRRPADRDSARDYTEGQASLGSSSPEGLVYFPEVLRFYLAYRPAAQLLAPPKPDEPLGKVLARVEAKSP